MVKKKSVSLLFCHTTHFTKLRKARIKQSEVLHTAGLFKEWSG